jgi:1-deoxy-D-xylulose-5-phosphate synthase
LDDLIDNAGRPASLLAGLDSPADLKKIPRSALPRLAEEIRREIIRVVGTNGGHLASSLGAVELIIALHYVLTAPEDQIIFDVGHQAYAHKILTGRRRRFETLRRAGGLSGFPKRGESPYDAFDTGHSSTSVSAALGLACARDLDGRDRRVVAVLGDGALTGGMALEAMNHAGALKKRLIVILNDNSMSISPNVGGLSEYLSIFVTRPAYVRFRRRLKGSLKQYLPGRSQRLINFLRRVEEALKSIFTSPSTLFEALGFKYLGPFDGHDAGLLIDALTGALNLDWPVLLHVVTTKGKGHPAAENDPMGFHGLGVPQKINELEAAGADGRSAPRESFSGAFGRLMLAEAEREPKLAAVSAAMSEGVGLAGFFEKYPERSFDVGIAEQHAVTLAAGLAAGGYRPVAAIYSSFLQRAFDQLYHDVALQKLPVVLAVDRAGPVGEDGPTHHGALDLSYLRLLPNFTVMAPADAVELEAMLRLALTLDGPSAIRYPRGAAPEPAAASREPVVPGRGVLWRAGRDLSIVALGPPAHEALAAAERLAGAGYAVSVLNLRFLKPLDRDLVLAEAQKTGRILTVEENVLSGGLFGAVSELLAGRRLRLRGLGLTDAPLEQGTQKSQRAALGLDAEGLFRAALEMLTDE